MPLGCIGQGGQRWPPSKLCIECPLSSRCQEYSWVSCCNSAIMVRYQSHSIFWICASCRIATTGHQSESYKSAGCRSHWASTDPLHSLKHVGAVGCYGILRLQDLTIVAHARTKCCLHGLTGSAPSARLDVKARARGLQLQPQAHLLCAVAHAAVRLQPQRLYQQAPAIFCLCVCHIDLHGHSQCQQSSSSYDDIVPRLLTIMLMLCQKGL